MALSAVAVLPNRVSAFWPFSSTADAASGSFTRGSSTPALQASTNIDPNPDKALANIQTSGAALLAQGGPSGTTADVVGSAPSDTISVYTVRDGDTLSIIAKMYGVSVNTIIWANNLSGMNDVHPGDTLIILPISGIQHVIGKNDTLRSIAQKYGADANEIAQYNGLDPAAPLALGSTVIIPGGEFNSPNPAGVQKPAKPRVPKKPAKGLREPFLGGSGPAQPGYYDSPIPGAILTQGVHGWNAVDFGAARGTPIRAAADGRVIVARVSAGWNGGYGRYVVITHDNGTQTLYAHMSSVTAYGGEEISAGQIIGYVGNTGLSTGAHLHFEVRGAANPFRECSVGSVCAPE
ncbi:MAG TPA: peptidoglycan DD-metalloendopeptidase family protein [Candidatus Paceibacterota bacterium]|nr:peptidoglycan DD-metalloendopeptidase family protein [Candidatus Paceibacterota bacterium]